MQTFVGKALTLSLLAGLATKTFGSFVVHRTCSNEKYLKPYIHEKSSVNHVMKRWTFNSQRKISFDRMKLLKLGASGISDFFNFFDDFNGENKKDKNTSGDEIDDNEDDYEDYMGCTNIFTIDVKSLKVGGCRLYLSLFFMGEANNPDRGTWKMNQNGDGGIDLYFKDTTGALIVVFKEDAIVVNRLGSSPSMEYLVQESSMLSGMLDQLDEIAMDTSINESDRLLCIEGDEINKVRESLSFT